MNLAPLYDIGTVVPPHMVEQVIREYVDVEEYFDNKTGHKRTIGEATLLKKVRQNITRLPFGLNSPKCLEIIANYQAAKLHKALGWE